MLKPRLVVSSCLLGEKVRYDGKDARNELALRLEPFCEVIKVCPEVATGLGVPRGKIVLYREEGEYRAFQPQSQRELTQELRSFAKDFLESLPPVDGFLLKSKSPSCGVTRTKTYRDREGKEYRGFGRGIFASEVMESFSYIPVEDELRLRKPERRLRFLTSLFLLAGARAIGKDRFHRRVSEFLITFAPRLEKRMRASGSIEDYRKLLFRALRKLPTGSLGMIAKEFVPSELF